MNKVPRFMLEYASFQTRKVMNDPKTESCRFCLISKIGSAVTGYQHGFLTVDEAMRLISAPIAD